MQITLKIGNSITASFSNPWQVMQPENVPLGAGGHPLQISVLRATSGLLSVLEAQPQLGRGFTPQEDIPGHERVGDPDEQFVEDAIP